MALHATLRTDVFHSNAIKLRTVKMLVPGPEFPTNPRDYSLEEVSFVEPESILQLADTLAEFQQVSTLAPAREATDVIYQDAFAQFNDPDWTIYAANPDDPANPDVVSTTAGTTITFNDEGDFVLTSATLNVVGDAVELTNVGGVATLTVTADAGTTYTAGDGLDLTANEFSVIGYAGIVVDGNGVSVEFTANKGLQFAGSGAAQTLEVKIGNGIEFVGGAVSAKASTGITVGAGGIAVSLSEGNLIDISGATIAVDFTEGSGYDAGENQVWTNLMGSIGWAELSDIAGVNTFSTIAVSGQTSVVADSTADTLTLVAVPGTVITTDAPNDTITFSSYKLIKGQATANYHPSSTSIVIDNVEALDGSSPVGNSTDQVTCYTANNVWLDDGETVYAVFNNDEELDYPVDSWDVSTAHNFRPLLAGLPLYDDTKRMSPIHIEDETDEGHQKIKWVESPEKELWCIDPDGGHTIATSGTTLTLTLKVTKYKFSAVNFISATDADVTVMYTGTACS